MPCKNCSLICEVEFCSDYCEKLWNSPLQCLCGLVYNNKDFEDKNYQIKYIRDNKIHIHQLCGEKCYKKYKEEI